MCGTEQRILRGGRRESVVEITNKQADNDDGFYAGVFLCESCVAEAARLIGYATEEDTEHAMQVAAEMTAERDFLAEQVDHLKTAVASLTSAGFEPGAVVETASKKVICDECPREFAHQGALNLHRRHAHPEMANV